jgi:hypothetical protein
MKQSYLYALIALAVFLSSCEAIGGIFKAGMGFGIFIVIFIVAIIIILVSKMRKK